MSSGNSSNLIYCRDEILQVIYWMKGEGLGENVVLSDLNRFLNITNDDLITSIEHLARSGLLELTGKDPSTWAIRISQEGIAEGRRRFKDEFEHFLGQEGHAECNDPDCDCHNPEWEGICENFSTHHRHDGT